MFADSMLNYSIRDRGDLIVLDDILKDHGVRKLKRVAIVRDAWLNDVSFFSKPDSQPYSFRRHLLTIIEKLLIPER